MAKLVPSHDDNSSADGVGCRLCIDHSVSLQVRVPSRGGKPTFREVQARELHWLSFGSAEALAEHVGLSVSEEERIELAAFWTASRRRQAANQAAKTRDENLRAWRAECLDPQATPDTIERAAAVLLGTRGREAVDAAIRLWRAHPDGLRVTKQIERDMGWDSTPTPDEIAMAQREGVEA